jgi:holo-[acyl-carrier protein] synthase
VDDDAQRERRRGAGSEAGVSIVGIGIDAVDVEDMRKTLARTPTFRERCFTPDERAYAEKQRDPSERFAVRFAVKEAVMKAMGLGLGAFGFYDVEVILADSGAPSLLLRDQALAESNSRGITDWHVTLTHTKTTAIANVIAEARAQ